MIEREIKREGPAFADPSAQAPTALFEQTLPSLPRHGKTAAITDRSFQPGVTALQQAVARRRRRLFSQYLRTIGATGTAGATGVSQRYLRAAEMMSTFDSASATNGSGTAAPTPGIAARTRSSRPSPMLIFESRTKICV